MMCPRYGGINGKTSCRSPSVFMCETCLPSGRSAGTIVRTKAIAHDNSHFHRITSALHLTQLEKIMSDE